MFVVQIYLKTEWNRVKIESNGGTYTESEQWKDFKEISKKAEKIENKIYHSLK